jgi:hypothetical protein
MPSVVRDVCYSGVKQTTRGSATMSAFDRPDADLLQRQLYAIPGVTHLWPCGFWVKGGHLS